jgi:UDP-N-acetylglucosamine 1-carboxyvinyltransferase
MLIFKKMGAKISGHGTDIVEIEGVDSLSGATHKPLPDRIEAGTFMIAAAITKGDIEINNIIPEHSQAVIDKLN